MNDEVFAKNNTALENSLERRGFAMSFMPANMLRGNLHYYESSAYRVNCQSCVVAFSARRRGLNCAAGRYDEDASGIMKRLGDNFSEAWVNPKTGKTLTPTILRGANDKEIIEKLKKQLLQPGEYVLGYNYKNGEGHVVNIINDGGNIIVHDEQAPRQSERYRNLESFEGIDYLELIRVDKALLNIKLTSQILFIL